MEVNEFTNHASDYIGCIFRDMIRHAQQCEVHASIAEFVASPTARSIPASIEIIRTVFRVLMSSDEHCDTWADIERIYREYLIEVIEGLSEFYECLESDAQSGGHATVQDVIAQHDLQKQNPVLYEMIRRIMCEVD